MIDREQVLHVAKLARLAFSDEEIERLAPELSKIVEYVEQMDRLDLEGVEPTSHVVELRTCCARTCRARACRRSARSSRLRTRPAADSGCRARDGVVVSELLGMTAAAQAELVRKGEASPAEVFEFWRGASRRRRSRRVSLGGRRAAGRRG